MHHDILIIDKPVTEWLDQSKPQFYRQIYHYSDQNNTYVIKI